MHTRQFVLDWLVPCLDTLFDPFAAGVRFPVAEDVAGEIAAFGGPMSSSVQFQHFHDYCVSPIRETNSGGLRDSLARRIAGHDLDGLATPITMGFDNIENGFSPFCGDSTLRSLMLYRVHLLAMCYLASGGDPQFDPAIDVALLPSLFSACTYSLEEGVPFSALDLVTINQLVKNVPRGTDMWAGVDLRYKDSEHFHHLFVRDIGSGVDGDISPQNLERCFGDYSSRKNGGLGLQLVRELAHMRGGHVVAATTSKGSAWTKVYWTGDRSLRLEPTQRDWHGSRFDVYVKN